MFKNLRTHSELARLARDIYTEDLENGYVTMLGEMVSGGVSDPSLGLEVVARLEPWIGVVNRKPRALGSVRYAGRSSLPAMTSRPRSSPCAWR